MMLVVNPAIPISFSSLFRFFFSEKCQHRHMFLPCSRLTAEIPLSK
jgi:hypothetical protein